MPVYMLDTNTARYFLQHHPHVAARVNATPMQRLRISAITGGELLFGLAKKPAARKLHALVGEFLRRVDLVPWDEAAMQHYGTLRAHLARQGMALAALDMLIAAHALSTKAVLVTHDAAFSRVDGLRVQDWTKAAH